MKKEQTNTIIWAVVALIVGVLIGFLVSPSVKGMATKSLLGGGTRISNVPLKLSNTGSTIIDKPVVFTPNGAFYLNEDHPAYRDSASGSGGCVCGMGGGSCGGCNRTCINGTVSFDEEGNLIVSGGSTYTSCLPVGTLENWGKKQSTS